MTTGYGGPLGIQFMAIYFAVLERKAHVKWAFWFSGPASIADSPSA